jgi:hypothetical protein
MRFHHVVAIAAVLVIGIGVKLFFFPAASAGANRGGIENLSMDASKIEVGTPPSIQKIHDMTVVFANGD